MNAKTRGLTEPTVKVKGEVSAIKAHCHPRYSAPHEEQSDVLPTKMAGKQKLDT
jgi:hypothetical protein